MALMRPSQLKIVERLTEVQTSQTVPQVHNVEEFLHSKKSKTLKCRRIGMATQIIKSNETSHVQVPMHHHTYTSTEAMTTAYHYNQRHIHRNATG